MLRLGQTVMTRGVNNRVADDSEFAKFVMRSLVRHQYEDWGDLDSEDKEANDYALHHDERVFSAYKFDDETKIWIITEWDRSVTTILFPSEY